MSDRKTAPRPVAVTITPVPARRKIRNSDPDPGGRRYRFKILVLAASLLMLIGGGGWLLHELAKKPPLLKAPAVSRVTVPGTVEDETPPAAALKAPAAAEPAPVQSDHPRGEQRPAGAIEALDRLMASARRQEQNGDLAGALAKYRQAAKIDPQASQPRRELQRVQQLLATQRYQQLMSEGLAAIHASNYRTARSKLLQARKIKPASREAADALSQVDQALRLEHIAKLGRRARAAEQTEDWAKAVEAYRAVLETDATLEFAIRGKTRALAQQRLFKRLDHFLANPKLLESDSRLRDALLLLDEAATAAVRGPKLNARLARLQQLVKTAQTPVRVVIESDNLTRVAVYRVGKLGRFAVRELQLRPGTYTVVGARDGYQDVRRRIVVKAGQPVVRIRIACRVKI